MAEDLQQQQQQPRPNGSSKKGTWNKRVKTSGSDLPQDVITEFLRRLDAVALLRFRAVSREWCSIISSPCFAKAHLRTAEESFSVIMRNTEGIACYDNNKDPRSVSYISHDKGESLLPFSSFDYINAILGCCNGLIFLYHECSFMIWNPTTRLLRPIICPSILTTYKDCDYKISGLGHDARTGDYYGVIAYHKAEPCSQDLLLDGVHGCLVNFTTLVCKQIKTCFLHIHHHDRLGTVLHGVPHWALRTESPYFEDPESFEGYPGTRVVSFDVENEIFKIISFFDGVRPWKVSLGVFKGFLCLICQNTFIGDPDVTEIWVMKEYGVESSWQKMFTFSPSIAGSLKGFTCNNKVLALHSNSSSLILYDPENSSVWERLYYDHKIVSHSGEICAQMIPFTKSLAWIHDA